MDIFPLQRIPDSQKTDKWFQTCAEYFISRSQKYDVHNEVMGLYNAVDGKLDPDYYKHVHNPYNSTSDKWNSMPAKMKYFNIIEPVIMSLVGEKGAEPDMVRIVAINPDVNDESITVLNEKLRRAAELDFANQVRMVQNNEEPKSEVNYTRILDSHNLTFKARRTMMANDVWEYLKNNLNYSDIKQELTFDFLTTGSAYTYKYVYRDEVYEEVVPPNEITVFSAPNTRFVSDAYAVVRWKEMTVSDILDRYRHLLTEQQKINLEKAVLLNDSTGGTYATNPNGQFTERPNMSHYETVYTIDNILTVWHVQWKGQKQIQIVTYTNDLGIESEKEVDMDYVLDPTRDISIRVEWISHTHEYYRLGYREYFGEKDPNEIPQRHLMSNVSKVKLNYDGIENIGRSGVRRSVVKSGIPYQALFNIYSFRTEMVMAMNRDKILLLPKGLKPKDWKFDDWLYYIHVTRMAFIDETNDKIATLVQAIKEIDLSLGSYIQDMVNLKQSIKQEWWDSVGYNRQRMGAMQASDGKAVTSEALLRSSLVTSEYLRKLASFEREDVAGLLDYSKFAYRKGKKASFVVDSQRQIMLDIEGMDWRETELGIFVKNSTSETEKVDLLKTLLQPMAQNNMSKAIISEIIDENNYEKIKQLMYKADEIERQFMENQTKQQTEAQKYAADKIAQTATEANDTKRYVADRQAESLIESTRIKTFSNLIAGGSTGKDGDGDGVVYEGLNDENTQRQLDEALRTTLDAYISNNQKNTIDYEKIKTDRLKVMTAAKQKKAAKVS